MYTDIFEQLGLSPNEAKIYDTLLDLKEAGVGGISSRAQIHRRNIYDAIQRLIDKGLVFSVIGKGEHLYRAVDPDKLMEFVKEKEIRLQQILPDLKKRHDAQPRMQEAYVYRGLEGFKNYMRDILRVGEDGYFVAAKLGWFEPRLRPFTKQFLQEARRKKLTFRNVFDAEVKGFDEETAKALRSNGMQYRFLPKKYSTNSAIDIFGDYVVTFTGLEIGSLDDSVTLYVLRDKNLADSYKKWFQFMWDMCPNEKKLS